ncbi:uncharacterized protein trdc [Symphorus nematophorus]
MDDSSSASTAAPPPPPPLSQGIQQGSVLSPLMFILYILSLCLKWAKIQSLVDRLASGNKATAAAGPNWRQDNKTVEPKLFVLSALQPEGVPLKDLADEVCLATDFRPQDGEVVLNVKDRQVSVNTSAAAVSNDTKSYYYAAFINETIYSCELHNTSSNNDNVGLCDDLHPEKAKLNFYLLMMNGIRVVFTKGLAFCTILTIRAVLS